MQIIKNNDPVRNFIANDTNSELYMSIIGNFYLSRSFELTSLSKLTG